MSLTMFSSFFTSLTMITTIDCAIHKYIVLNNASYALKASSFSYKETGEYVFEIRNPGHFVMQTTCVHTIEEENGFVIIPYDNETKLDFKKIKRGEQITILSKKVDIRVIIGNTRQIGFACLISIPPNDIVREANLKVSPNETSLFKSIEHFAPWYVPIQTTNWFFCSGTMISDNALITTSECTEKAFDVRIPYDNYVGKSMSIKENQFDRFIYNTKYADIGLIKLKFPVEIGKYVYPLSIHRSKDKKISYELMLVVNSASTRADGIRMIESESCSRRKPEDRCLRPEFRLPGYNRKGDPVVFKEGGIYYMYGMYCERSVQDTVFSAYTAPGRHYDWISDIMGWNVKLNPANAYSA